MSNFSAMRRHRQQLSNEENIAILQKALSRCHLRSREDWPFWT